MSEHTPGPWAVGKSGMHVYFAPDAYTDEQIDADPRYDSIVADTRPYNAAFSGIPDSEMEANARLIAAAPEMFEALKALDLWTREGSPLTLIQRLDPIVDRARAAIAKAEGR